jgi:hypothetical protein
MIYAKDIDFFTKFSELSFQDVHFQNPTKILFPVETVWREKLFTLTTKKMMLPA